MPQGLYFDFTLAQLKHNKLGGIPGGHAVECTVNDGEWPSDDLLNDPNQTCDCGCGCICDNFADVEPNAPDELRFTGDYGRFFTGVPGKSFPVDLVLKVLGHPRIQLSPQQVCHCRPEILPF